MDSPRLCSVPLEQLSPFENDGSVLDPFPFQRAFISVLLPDRLLHGDFGLC